MRPDFSGRSIEKETEVLDALKGYMAEMPAYNPRFFRVAEPAEPKFPLSDLPSLIAFNQKAVYDFDNFLARLVDNSEHLEFRPGYGPEVYTGLVKIDGFLIGVIGNRQGFLGPQYPEYTNEYIGVGGKLYRQGLVKMNEFVTQCGRDRVPVVWFQDTSGIDVGDIAEKAELLGLGQSLIYSIEQTDVPMMLVVLRKGTAAAHYVMGGPTANNHNAFTLGTATTEIYVMHGETASVASFARRLVKEKDSRQTPPADHRQDERPGPAVLRPVPAGVLRQTGFRGRDRPLRGYPPVPGGLRQLRLSEPQFHLPPAPPDAAPVDSGPDRQGLGAAEKGKLKGIRALPETVSLRTQKGPGGPPRLDLAF